MLADPLETRCKCREDAKHDKLFLHLQVTLYLYLRVSVNGHVIINPESGSMTFFQDDNTRPKKEREHDRAPLANAKQKTPSASHIPS